MTTVADQRRYDKLQSVGCICCFIDGRSGVPGDIHHLVDKGNRDLSGGNSSTFVICIWHHRGIVPPGETVASATLKYGPSLRHTSKLFHAIYGSQRELLAKANDAIGVQNSANIGTGTLAAMPQLNS